MAHLAKYNKNAVGHMINHYERTEASRKRENVDESKTYVNYNLCTGDSDGKTRLKNILDAVYCLKRKDVNVVCDWVVTMPKTLQAKYQEKFFEETYNFLTGRYGKTNVVGAYVHNDEAQPHIHFCFVPIKYDEKKKRCKVSAKEVITRKDLKTFHPDLQKYLTNKLNVNIDILNGATIEGNKSIKELKQQTAIKKLEQLNNKIDYAKEELEELKNVNACLGLGAGEVPKAKQGKINKNNVVLDKEDYNKLVNTINLNDLLKKENAALKKQINYLEKSNSYNKMKDLEDACFKLTYKNKNLENDLKQEKKENKQLTQIIEHIFKQFPNVKKYIFNLSTEKNKNIGDDVEKGKNR